MGKQTSPSTVEGKRGPTVRWLDEPEEHDYPAAASFLSLIAGPKAASRAVTALREAVTLKFKAKDLLRAAGLPLLPVDDPEVSGSGKARHSHRV